MIRDAEKSVAPSTASDHKAGSSTKAGNDEMAAAAACTILVVDDELMVRAVVSDMLRELGYSVCEAGSANEAIYMLGQRPTIATVLTDIRMPGVSGIELAQHLTRARPSTKVIYMTAYAREMAAQGTQLLNFPILLKPFTFAQLEKVLAADAQPN